MDQLSVIGTTKIKGSVHMTNFMTVVIKYESGAELPKKLTKAFTESVHFDDVEITGISFEDEISRVEQLEAEA